MAHATKWWKESVIYQIYPASFKDSNGDGIGDIPGIISKLDYLQALGIDVLWVSPFYRSPQVDLGYDISDYQDVHEPYGKVSDVEALIKGAHDRGIKILFDLVINHTSSEHRWFKESRSSKCNSKRDWYIWRPPRIVDGERRPPCNWRSNFGGSVWEWDEETKEYYLHLFCPEQPDVNWENAEVRKALYKEAILFWLDKGVDGFRIDTVNMYSKFEFVDVPVTVPETPWQPAADLFTNGPHLHDFLKEMRKETFDKYDCVAIGELPNTRSFDKVLSYISAKAGELDMVIQFDICDLDHRGGRYPLMARTWTLAELKQCTKREQQLTSPTYDAWALSFWENHDQARSVSRFASDAPEHRVVSAKLLATYLLTLSGTPIIYQGEELGMINAPKSWSIEEEYKDVNTINTWKEIVADSEHDPGLLQRGREGIQLTARDHCRTPMQWDPSSNAGFTSGDSTWMRVMESYVDINAADEENDACSPLHFYKRLLALRKQHKELFVYGQFEMHDETNPHTLIYSKRHGKKAALVALNFTASEQPIDFPDGTMEGRSLLLSTLGKTGKSPLGPYESRIYLA